MTEILHRAEELHLGHQLVSLPRLLQLLDVGDRQTDQEVGDDETEDEDEEYESEVGGDREVLVDRLLTSIRKWVGETD